MLPGEEPGRAVVAGGPAIGQERVHDALDLRRGDGAEILALNGEEQRARALPEPGDRAERVRPEVRHRGRLVDPIDQILERIVHRFVQHGP